MYYLEATNIVKQYGDYTALNDVSIKVRKGTVYGLLGPNGAGKSSLIRIINRITAPDQGEVLIDGEPTNKESVYNIGYLPEERGLYKKMKVEEHIIFLARLKGLSKADAQAKTEAWLQKFNIADWRNKKIEELSKGMQQKIQFIATVIHEPKLYILDEPFSGFDPVNAELLKNEILELKAKGYTIILSTHNMESVEELCDEISLIHKSQVILQGNVKEIRRQFKEHLFSVEVEGDRFAMGNDAFSILSTQTDGITTTVSIKRNDESSSSSQLALEIASNYEIVSFVEELPTMNEIFIKLVSNK